MIIFIIEKQLNCYPNLWFMEESMVYFCHMEYIQKLSARITQVHIIQCNRTIRFWFWLIMDNCTIWSGSVDRWEAQTTKPGQLPVD